MKWIAVLLICGIVLGALLPPSLPMTMQHDGHAEIGTLDICHSAVPALSSSGEMPYINILASVPFAPATITYLNHSKPHFTLFVIPTDTDRPPKA